MGSYPKKRKWLLMNRIKTSQIRVSLLLVLVIVCGYQFILRPEDPKSAVINQDEVKADHENVNKPTTQVITGSIAKKSSLYLSLIETEAPQELVGNITRALHKVFDLKHSLPGDAYLLEYCPPDTLVNFEYEPPGRDKYLVQPQKGLLVASKVHKDLDRFLRYFRGRVEESLWNTLVEMGEDTSLILKLADIFAWEIDFLTDVRDGDEFELVIECLEEKGKFAFYGDILVARYSLQGSEHFGILYQNPEGHRDHYDLEGKSLRKTLLKSPLSYRRISSKYSPSRLHPILKIRRPHYGIDYAAKTGTPVVAAGDGQVTYKGWKGDYGKTVIIRHALGYQTYYGHLSRFARKLSKRASIKQGQVIGYVGNTGLSTGPHLDYRVKKDGKYIDPLKMDTPSVAPVQKEFMQDYFQVRDEMLAKMQFMAGNDKICVSRSQKD